MKSDCIVPTTIDAYIAAFPAEVQAILQRIRATVQAAAPAATEKISYGIPTFVLHGNLVHFAAFKRHIGIFPPVHDAALRAQTARHAGPKGNLRFPLDEPMPYALIGRLTEARVKEQLALKVASKRTGNSAAVKPRAAKKPARAVR